MRLIKIILLLLIVEPILAQDELLELLDDAPTENLVTATFKSTRLVNGHTVEVRTPGVLELVISHRFGRVNLGSQEFWGLDQATIRLGLEYGLAKNLNIGIGRASYFKAYDTYLKYRAIRQSDAFPVSVTGFGSIVYTSDQSLPITKFHRYDYTAQLLIARKVNANLSVQLMPTFIQRNLVNTNDDANGLVAIGMGGRYKISNRVAINTEYYPQLTSYSAAQTNVFAIGVDIETGGHVFQLHLTNAQQMNEPGFIGETEDDFFKGDIHFGFNISRVFDLKPKK
jgi:hypothetical protein